MDATAEKKPKKPIKMKPEAVAAIVDDLCITSIKAFDADMKCRGFQFEFGKTYEVAGKIEACANGFHACPVDNHPLSVLEYYPPISRFAEVRQAGAIDKQGTKLASAKITIGVEISMHVLISRAVKWVFNRAKPEGESSHATGWRGAASATGKGCVAMSIGISAKAMAMDGNAICLVHRDGSGEIIHIRASKVGENGIKPGIWYSLDETGEFVEATEWCAVRHFSDTLTNELQIARLTCAPRSLSETDLDALAPVVSEMGREAMRVERLRRMTVGACRTEKRIEQ